MTSSNSKIPYDDWITRVNRLKWNFILNAEKLRNDKNIMMESKVENPMYHSNSSGNNASNVWVSDLVKKK